MNNLFLVRGLPGSGKSTFAKTLSDTICEADSFFMTKEVDGKVVRHAEDGEYFFDHKLIGRAHQECQNKCESLMQSDEQTVVVSNTFTTPSEMKPYYKLAEKYGYRVTSLVVENRHGGSTIHDVPEKTIERMRNRFNIQL